MGQDAAVTPQRCSRKRAHSDPGATLGFYSADRHLTQRNAELGGATRRLDKERFQNMRATGLPASCVRTCTTRWNLQIGCRQMSAICWN